ncbi:hypothetical protein [Streptomyces paludis]|uniref:Zf-HC2 domain-containing protein n=1 Tax=Streptomyces paludis TaxID=2282738 RepID=A0A345HQA4_9ACTN|nr:hypothetical protein [Streptomyces paludis]AXG78878.1 hypothetical protein DVK44_15510 [Streptomyces paludis]
MTSTTDTAQHPDVSEISDLTEGLLSPSRTSDVRDHLDGCVLCADVHDSLEEIKGLLGTLPGPPRMPADIAGRIDAALAAEALLNATTPAESVSDEPVTTAVTARAESDESARVSRETPSPAEPAPLVAAEGVRSDRPAGRPRAATGPGRSTRARRRRTALLGAVFGTAAVGVGVLLFQNGAVSTQDASDSQAKAVASASGQDGGVEFSGDLQSRVDALLNTPAAERAVPKDATASVPFRGTGGERSASPSYGLRGLPEIPDCIQRGTGRSDTALAAEQGSYEGSPAYLVVLPYSGDNDRVQAYVIDASCVENASAAKGKVLLTHAYLLR